MTRLLLITLLLFVIFSCRESSTKKNKSRTASTHYTDSLIQSETTIKFKENISDVYPLNYKIGLLRQFENNEKHYVSLNIKENVSGGIRRLLKDTIYHDDLTLNLKIPDEIAEKFLDTEGLGDVLIFDSIQNCIGTSDLTSYEYYDNGIVDLYVATYPYLEKVRKSEKVILSKLVPDSLLKKSPIIYKDKDELMAVLNSNKMEPKSIYSYFNFSDSEDKYILLSTLNQNRDTSQIILFKNGVLKESLKQNSVLMKLYPVPLATDNLWYFIAVIGIIDSNVVGDIVIKIDREEGKFHFHRLN